jgi:heptosyltransferase-2
MVTPEVRWSGRERLVQAGWDERRPLAALAPGAANGRAKQWPPASFATVAAELVADGVVPVMIGTTADSAVESEIMQALEPNVRNAVISLVGRTDLLLLAGVLVHCRALVTNDSGGMHFAMALGVNVTAMFGPSNEDETRPIGTGRAEILVNPVWCRPCMLRRCPIDHRCLRGIAPERVVAATRQHLRTP